ncbi:MAG: PspC domain-containing protein [Acidimicrobiia bacterium]|nr:PspC domain-containing protein [Acidimicrobiia bacterium]
MNEKNNTPTLSYVPTDRVLQRKNGKIAGVAGGFADYFDLDVTLVRLAFVALTLLTWPALPLAYIVAWIIIPEEDRSRSTTQTAPVAMPVTPSPAPAAQDPSPTSSAASAS